MVYVWTSAAPSSGPFQYGWTQIRLRSWCFGPCAWFFVHIWAWSHPFTIEVDKLGDLPADTALHGWRRNAVRWARDMAGVGL